MAPATRSVRASLLALAAAAALAGAAETGGRAPDPATASYAPVYGNPLDLFPVSGFWRFQAPRGPAAGEALRFRFGDGSPVELAFGSAMSAVLFTLAVVNAFVPRWLPPGWGGALAGRGTPGDGPPPIGGPARSARDPLPPAGGGP